MRLRGRLDEDVVWILAALVVGVIVGGAVPLLTYDPLPAVHLDPEAAPSPSASASPTPSPSPKQEAPSVVSVTREAGEPLRVLFVGGSVTAGFFASSEEASYVGRVVDVLETSGPVDVTDVHMPDAATETVTSVVPVESDPDVVVVELGMEDVGATEPRAFGFDYRSLLRQVTDASPDVGLVCLGIWSDVGASYDSMIERACQRRGGVFVPLNLLYAEPANRGPAGELMFDGTSDEIHPNDAGHEAIAEEVLGVIQVG